jgi:hypothetical protein
MPKDTQTSEIASPKTIGDRIAELRKQLGWNQGELSFRIDVSPSAVSQYENNATQPSLDTAAALSRELGVSVDWLLGLNEDSADAARAAYRRVSEMRLLRKLTQVIDEGVLQQGDIELLAAMIDRMALKVSS